MGYGSDSLAMWDSQRRVCVEAHFDTYFGLSLSDSTLPMRQINELIERADKKSFVQGAFRLAAQTARRGRGTMVTVFLDELTTHAMRVEKDKVEPLLSALFEIHDEIDLGTDPDQGFLAVANTTLRYHWLMRRLTRERFTIDERTHVYLAATEAAPLGWIVECANAARRDYRASEKGLRREEDCQVTEEAANGPLTERALKAIGATADNGSLVRHPDLLYILYAWRNFLGGDATEVRAWTDSLMQNDEALAILARRMTGTSWTASGGFGSLADRVARPSVQAMIADDTDIIDVASFRAGLERIRDEAGLDDDRRTEVQIFLDAWNLKTEGEN
jgi:hypothetical protein